MNFLWDLFQKLLGGFSEGAGKGAANATSEFLQGPTKLSKVPTYNKGQKNTLQDINDLLQQLTGKHGGMTNALDYFKDLLDPESEEYQNLVAPYMREFEESTIPNLAERFAGKGALSSSAFGQSLSAAGAGLQEKLAALRSGQKGEAAKSLTNTYGNLANQSLSATPFGYTEKKGWL